MTGRDDRLLAPTLWTAVMIVPVLVAAWVILYLFPQDTKALWAWTIAPSMTAMVMGGGYLSGAYFFARVATVRKWHRAWPGFIPSLWRPPPWAWFWSPWLRYGLAMSCRARAMP